MNELERDFGFDRESRMSQFNREHSPVNGFQTPKTKTVEKNDRIPQ